MCEHSKIQVRYEDDRFWHYVPRSALAKGSVVAVRCARCYTVLPLGPTNDAPDTVQVEILAAEVGQDPDVWRRFMDLEPSIEEDLHRLGACGTLSLGALSPDAGHLDLNPPPRWTVSEHHDYLSGWLALELATHDDRDQRDATCWPWDPTRPLAGQYEEWLARGDAMTTEQTCEACDTADGCEEHRMFTCANCKRTVPWSEGGTDDGFEDECSDCWLTAQSTFSAADHEAQRAADPDCRDDDNPDPDDIPIRAGAPEVIGLTPRQVREQTAAAVAAEDALRDPDVMVRNAARIAESPGDAFLRRTAGMVNLTADDLRTRIGRKP